MEDRMEEYEEYLKAMRRWAIDNHRTMWTVIADRIEKRQKVVSIRLLKAAYCRLKGRRLLLDCFLCDYSREIAMYITACSKCPLNPAPQRALGCLGGLYHACLNATDWKEQARLAREIANLPEREDA